MFWNQYETAEMLPIWGFHCKTYIFSVLWQIHSAIRSLHQNLPVILSEYCLEIQIKYAIKTKEPEEKGQKHIFFL